MANGSERIFRASALQRAASPDELDHLVAITKPSDWILAAVLAVALVAAIVWGIFGRIPSRVSGQGCAPRQGSPAVQYRLLPPAAARAREPRRLPPGRDSGLPPAS